MIPAPCNPSGSTKMVSASRLAHARDQAGDREYPLRRYRYEHAIIHGWNLYRTG